MAATIVVTVEVQFDGATWTDISQHVRRVSLKYGRQRLLDETSAGSCRIEADNSSDFLTPGHTGSTYGDTQLINRQVKVASRGTGGSDSYNTYLWRGVITDIDYSAGHGTSTVHIHTVDGFDRLAKAEIFEEDFATSQ